MAALEPGGVIAGYRLERLLGRGGMGAVWLAIDERLGRRVALKVLPPELAGDSRFRQRFLAESRLAASLDHPHIVPVFDAGEADSELYIAMRYVEGDTLEGLIRAGPLEPARALALLRGVADALDAAHAAGLVHRDVKPGNILVSRTPSGEHAYLADFGLVKRLGDASLTGTGQIIGSVGYLAPEQVEGGGVDGRADVYSLGCVLYAAVTGVAPYQRDTDLATLYAHVQAPPPRPSIVRPELAALDPVIERAMAKDPGDRFRTAGALMAAAADAFRSGTTRGFLFADLRGYTAFVERHGDQAAAVLLARYRELARNVIASHEGAEIRTEGDSFYVVFPSASRAVAAGLALVDAAAQATSVHPDEPISVGVGVHAGETADTDEGPVGSAVNTAARLCAAARPGEVLVSDTVRSLVRTSLAVTFDSRGRKSLKGLAEPVVVYGVRRGSSQPSTSGPPTVRLGSALRGGRASGALVLGGAVLLVAAVAASGLLGRTTGGAPPSSPPSSPSSPSAAGASSGVGAGASGEWIAYSRTAAHVDGTVDCALSTSWISTIGEIRVIRPDGTGDRRLAPTSGLFEHRPDWATDGATILLLGAGSDRDAVWSTRPDGTDLEPLIGDIGSDELPGAPTSAVDGRIAWVDYQTNAIGVANGDGSGRKRLPTGVMADLDKSSPASIQDLDWLPDGRLGFVAVAEPQDSPGDLAPGVVYTIGADGSGLTKVESPAGLQVAQARWSPDGSRIALTILRGGATDIAVLADGALIDITGGSGADAATDRDPAWSPDGTTLAFASDRGGTYEIYTADADSGSPTQVTDTEPTRASCAPSWGATAMTIPGPEPSPSPGSTTTLRRGWLAGGTYEASTFDPPFTIELPADWQAWMADADDTWLRRLGGAATADVDITRITVAYPDGCLETPTELAPTDAHDLVSWLQGHPNVTVGAPRAVSVGGAAGIQVDVTGVGPVPCEAPPNRIFLFDVANGSVFVRPDETIRLIAIDVGDTLVVVVPRAYSTVGTLDEDLYRELVQPVLGSIEFTRP